MTCWLIDGMNVIGSRPDGWWRDRERAKRKLATHLQTLTEANDQVTVVFDGGEPAGPIEVRGVEVLYAPGGPNAADDRIVALVEADPGKAGLTVVTSDSDLAERVAALGASVIGAGELRRRLDG